MKKDKLLLAFLSASLVFTSVGCAKKDILVKEEIVEENKDTVEKEEVKEEKLDETSSASVTDSTTSASVVPKDLLASYSPKGFTDSDKKKVLFVVGDPRKDSVQYDLVNTSMKHFEENGMEVEIRDLYDMKFDPVLTLDNFFYAKDGSGKAPENVLKEQEYVSKSDHIIFCYPNWHDTPTAIIKGYMEKVFAKKYAYQDSDKGLEGLLKNKTIYTIMNAGFLGGGRGYIDDGVGIDDESWNKYMGAFKVLDDDTAGFWGVTNKGRFVNDRTPKNNSEKYEEELNSLREDLKKHLDKDFFE